MKRFFNAFLGKKTVFDPFEMQDKQFVYCFIRLPMSSLLDDRNELSDLVSKIFRIVEDASGDVNQFCCDTILAIFGAPFPDPSLYAHLKKFVRDVSAINAHLQVCLGQDVGLYGTIGYEKRKIITAMSKRMVSDFRELEGMSSGVVHVHRDFLCQLGELDCEYCVKSF